MVQDKNSQSALLELIVRVLVGVVFGALLYGIGLLLHLTFSMRIIAVVAGIIVGFIFDDKLFRR